MKIRAWLWWAGAPARWLSVGLIRAYRMIFAGSFGGQCRFSPSCSHYAEDAIRVHGVMRGVALGCWRILRCNPFGRPGVDHVPPYVAMHDAVIRSGGDGSVERA